MTDLTVLSDAAGPLTVEDIARHFQLTEPDRLEALSRRLNAMLRDGQLLILRSTVHSQRLLADTLGPLRAYDAERRTELVATLRAYFEAGYNLTRAAQALNVHANTVVYRLRRVRELTGRDPHDPDDLLLLSLGLKL